MSSLLHVRCLRHTSLFSLKKHLYCARNPERYCIVPSMALCRIKLCFKKLSGNAKMYYSIVFCECGEIRPARKSKQSPSSPPLPPAPAPRSIMRERHEAKVHELLHYVLHCPPPRAFREGLLGPPHGTLVCLRGGECVYGTHTLV